MNRRLRGYLRMQLPAQSRLLLPRLIICVLRQQTRLPAAAPLSTTYYQYTTSSLLDRRHRRGRAPAGAV
eukprot:scaffold22957_cov58-Phaeocystis_antarctica.AAC.5